MSSFGCCVYLNILFSKTYRAKQSSAYSSHLYSPQLTLRSNTHLKLTSCLDAHHWLIHTAFGWNCPSVQRALFTPTPDGGTSIYQMISGALPLTCFHCCVLKHPRLQILVDVHKLNHDLFFVFSISVVSNIVLQLLSSSAKYSNALVFVKLYHYSTYSSVRFFEISPILLLLFYKTWQLIHGAVYCWTNGFFGEPENRL